MQETKAKERNASSSCFNNLELQFDLNGLFKDKSKSSTKLNLSQKKISLGIISFMG